MSVDSTTAAAFASSWNNLPAGSVYTVDQFEDWLAPLTRKDIAGRRVLELGCGNASLLVHMAGWNPSELIGVDLGDSVLSATENLRRTNHPCARIVKADLVEFRSDGFDVVYCIGVLHHLKDPGKGFRSVVENTRAGGAFHCWVYGKEGNALVRLVVEPTRKIASRLPWWFTKYLIATPLVAPYYIYAKLISFLKKLRPPLSRQVLGTYRSTITASGAPSATSCFSGTLPSINSSHRRRVICPEKKCRVGSKAIPESIRVARMSSAGTATRGSLAERKAA